MQLLRRHTSDVVGQLITDVIVSGDGEGPSTFLVLPGGEPRRGQKECQFMAQRTIVHLVDDVSGDDADETISFALDGQPYEIDLSADNAARLRESLSEFVASARKAGVASRAPRRSSGRRANGTSDVRAWARENGFTISERGRIPSNVIEAYQAAH